MIPSVNVTPIPGILNFVTFVSPSVISLFTVVDVGVALKPRSVLLLPVVN